MNNYRGSRGLMRGLIFLGMVISVLVAGCALNSGGEKIGKSCLDCHAEVGQKYARGAVHQPVIRGNCGDCHRRHGLIGGAFLKQPLPTLCFRCHQNIDQELQSQSIIHAPVKEGRCDRCHQPHNSDQRFLLAEEKTELCFGCHGRQEFRGTYRHAPLSDGCTPCHTTHTANQAKLLRQTEEKLCAGCHKIQSEQFIRGHGGNAVTQLCSECHAVHTADNPALLKPVIHAPVAQGQCQECHQPATSKSEYLLTKNANELCEDCHLSAMGKYSSMASHAPVAAGDCLACHQAHASSFGGMLNKDPKQLCVDCHGVTDAGSAKTTEEARSQHAPVQQGDCLKCHSPHFSVVGQKPLLRKNVTQLCSECHSQVKDKHRYSPQPVVLGSCVECHSPHQAENVGLLRQPQFELCGACHDQIFEERRDPSVHRPFVAGQCSTCHTPHTSELKGLQQAATAAACALCHNRVEAERQLPNRHRPFQEGQCALCHQPHSGQKPYLQTNESVAICIDCHAERKPILDTPAGHQNCTVCHYAHGNDELNNLLQELPQLCVNCHAVNRDWNTGVGHQPAVAGQCKRCHDPHQPQNSLTNFDGAKLCGKCHAVDSDSLASNHSNQLPTAANCLSCHDPHGGPDKSLTLPIKHAPFAEGTCVPCHHGGQL